MKWHFWALHYWDLQEKCTTSWRLVQIGPKGTQCSAHANNRVSINAGARARPLTSTTPHGTDPASMTCTPVDGVHMIGPSTVRAKKRIRSKSNPRVKPYTVMKVHTHTPPHLLGDAPHATPCMCMPTLA